MCGRYYIADEDAAEELKQIIDEVNRRYNGTSGVKTAGEVFPMDIVPVIAESAGEPEVQIMRWGYTLPDNKISFNARSEEGSVSRMYRVGLETSRCLIPATNYFEWCDGMKPKPKYEIKPADGDIMYMAGVYRQEGNRRVFSILTRKPAESIRFIHDRMPVILPAFAAKDWLNTRYKAEEILAHANLNVVARSLMPEQISMDI